MPKNNCKKSCKNNKNNFKIQAEFAICNSNLLRVFTAPKSNIANNIEKLRTKNWLNFLICKALF